MTAARPIAQAFDATGLPLEGIRVVDLTHVWSGPSATRLLAALGAEVLKIEGPRRLDFLRGTGAADAASRYPDGQHGADPWNRNAWFNTVNTDKRDVLVDLKRAEGLELVLDLVACSQLVIANYRPGVLERMGLGYDALKRRRPDVILVEMTGYGSTGPMAGLQAYGAQFDAMSGAAWLTGDGDRPLLTGFALSDPVAGLAAASAAVSAVARWRRTGEGSNIEVIQRDAMVPLHGEYLLAASRGTKSAGGLNSDPDGFPHGIYEMADGSWIALAVYDSAGWEGLLAVVDESAREELGAFRTYEAATHARSAVECALRGWLLTRTDAAALSESLQRKGVSAAPVNDGRAVYEDADLRRTGFLRELDHPRVGRHLYPGAPLTLDGRRVSPRHPAPHLDRDTDAVLESLCGLTKEQIADLRERGVVGASEDFRRPTTPSEQTADTQKETTVA